MPRDLQLSPDRLYSVALDDIIRPNGDLYYHSSRGLRQAFHLPPDGRLCLVASIKDALLERMWQHSAINRLWSRIRGLNFEFVTSLSFSVFENQPRGAQILMQEKNLLAADLLAAAGIPVVPLILDIFEEDLEHTLKWLADRPEIETVGGLAQNWRRPAELRRFLDRMLFIKQYCPRPLHFLIVGCHEPARIQRLAQELGSISTSSENLVQQAIHGRVWDSQRMRFLRAGTWEPRAGLVVESLESYCNLCDSLRHSLKMPDSLLPASSYTVEIPNPWHAREIKDDDSSLCNTPST